jgi:urease subunit alpha
VGLQANARAADDAALEPLLAAGAVGFKIHEDYGASPELIDHVLRFADARDISVSLHTDGLHETAELEDTVAAIAGRAVHAYHVEGSGGGHIPDVIGLVREANIICSSTTPTIPWGVSAADETLAMTMLNHGASWAVPEDVALVLERRHPATMAAEGPLHELGAIQIVNSDSQGMGRIMETVRRTFQLAHVMKAWRGSEAGRALASFAGLPDEEEDDGHRVLRYLAKVTIEPAITHGISGHVGTLAPGRIADIVLWKPAYFGVKPELVVKGGHRAWSPLGDGNASVERAEPTRFAREFAGLPDAAPTVAVTFVSGSADPQLLGRRLGSQRAFIAVRGCRGLTRAALSRNRATAAVDVDPVTGRVTLGGRTVEVPSATELPLNRRYFLR